jgi:DNA-binding beta-propeller fold protein YncE
MTAAASADGKELAYATFTQLVAYGPTGAPRTIALAPEEQPLAALIDAHDNASVITTSGHWYRLGSSTVRLPVGSVPLTAAAMDSSGNLYLLNDQGRLSRYRAGKISTVAQVDPSLSGFALRLTADGRIAAVIGTTGSVVLSTLTGRTMVSFPSDGTDSSIVRDIALTAKTAWAIRASGELVRVPILSDEQALSDGVESIGEQ